MYFGEDDHRRYWYERWRTIEWWSVASTIISLFMLLLTIKTMVTGHAI
jgi:hypothetical protein